MSSDGVDVYVTKRSNRKSSSSSSGVGSKRFVCFMICSVLFILCVFVTFSVGNNIEINENKNKKEDTEKKEENKGNQQKNEEGKKKEQQGNKKEEKNNKKETTSNIIPGQDNEDGTYTYQRRGQPMDEKDRNDMIDTWGEWTFSDPNKAKRPTNDFYSEYLNRDVPKDKFPKDAWQKDKEYMKEFLYQSKALVERAIEAILAEYGYGKFDDNEKSSSKLSMMERLDKFAPFPIKDKETDAIKGVSGNGGHTSRRSFNGLIRRVLHAVMTEDTFTFSMGGHSAAAGHGNHFIQSYTLVFQRIMEPIFARLGVKLISRNIALGGLGTVQNGMASGDIYGQDVDFLLWDSGMTETNEGHTELFFRQGILGGRRVPACWGGNPKTVKFMHDKVKADVGQIGYGNDNLQVAEVFEDLAKIPYAARYMKCSSDLKNDVCNLKRYNGTCWVDRPDGWKPPKTQDKVPGGRASWHYGNREHQLRARTLSLTILRALLEGFKMWEEKEDYILQDDDWHVTEHYETIRRNLLSLDEGEGMCYKKFQSNKLPLTFCDKPMRGRTEYAPRANAKYTNVRTLMKPTPTGKKGEDGKEIFYKPHVKTFNIYDPPDVRNPRIDIPKGEVDVLSIVESGKDFEPVLNPYYPPVAVDELVVGNDYGSNNRDIPALFQPKEKKLIPLAGLNNNKKKNDDDFDIIKNIVPGLGWDLVAKTSADKCDGTIYSFCGRSANAKCMLYGHNDDRGGLSFDSLSGWGIFTLRGVKYGTIAIGIHSWHGKGSHSRTEGWTTINNDGTTKSSLLRRRRDLQEEEEEEEEELRLDSFQSSSNNNTYNLYNNNNDNYDDDDYNYIRTDDHDDHYYHADHRHRALGNPPGICPDFKLEYVINGKYYYIDEQNFLKGETRDRVIERVVEVVSLLDDPKLTNGEIMDVEIAVRMIGCDHINVFFLTHIYWA